jgi:hypothetical protein
MGEFVSLTSVLDEWFDKDRSELPDALASAWRGSRQAGGLNFLLSVWPGLSPAQRRIMAAQIDASRDPANQNTGTEEWDLIASQFKMESDRKEIEAGITTDVVRKQERLDYLSREIAGIEARLSELSADGRTAAGDTSGSPAEMAPDFVDPLVGRKTSVSRPPKKRGPRAIKRIAGTNKMVADVRAGKCTLEEFHNMKQSSLAQQYGFRSRGWAQQALADAEAILSDSNPDKPRQTPTNDK